MRCMRRRRRSNLWELVYDICRAMNLWPSGHLAASMMASFKPLLEPRTRCFNKADRRPSMPKLISTSILKLRHRIWCIFEVVKVWLSWSAARSCKWTCLEAYSKQRAWLYPIGKLYCTFIAELIPLNRYSRWSFWSKIGCSAAVKVSSPCGVLGWVFQWCVIAFFYSTRQHIHTSIGW